MADVMTLTREMKSSTRNKTNIVISTLLTVSCFVLLVVALYANANLKTVFPPKIIERYVSEWLENPPELNYQGNSVRTYHWEYLRGIYQMNRQQMIWFDSLELKPHTLEMLQAMKETVADDRYFYRYNVAALIDAVKGRSNLAIDIVKLDILLTDAFISFSQDSLNNDFVPDINSHDHSNEAVKVSLNPQIRLTTDEVVNWFERRLANKTLSEGIIELTPQHPGYLRLREHFNRYVDISSSNQWVEMPEGPDIAAGEYHQDIGILRNSLYLFGDYTIDTFANALENAEHLIKDESPQTELFLLDPQLVTALINYQKRNGLNETGILDDKTRTQLAKSPHRIARQIALNMKRWRRLPDVLGDKHIMVNMAGFYLEYNVEDKALFKTKVIVGRPNRRTPTLVDPMKTLVLNPTWTVPRRIALLDILPRVKKDPVGYLTRQNMEIISGWGKNLKILDPTKINWSRINSKNLPFYFRQRSGENNSLGLVKFALPNDMAIYLHDTNHKELFAKDSRALSSGCVRVENPLTLVEELLAPKTGWNKSKIDRVIAGGKTTYVPLSSPVPVYLIYWTSWIDDHGVLQHRNDVYDWDRLEYFSQGKTEPNYVL